MNSLMKQQGMRMTSLASREFFAGCHDDPVHAGPVHDMLHSEEFLQNSKIVSERCESAAWKNAWSQVFQLHSLYAKCIRPCLPVLILAVQKNHALLE